MSFVYLDHNIYIYSLTDQRIADAVEEMKKRGICFVYSPAHIEEIYKARIEQGVSYHETMKSLIKLISTFTDNTEFLPSNTSIIIKNEHPDLCYKRVFSKDTTERIKNDSWIKYEVDRQNYREMIEADKHLQSISTIPPDKLWEHEVFKAALIELNQSMREIVLKNNNSIDTLVCACWGADKTLPVDLQIEEGAFPKLRKSHTQLEFVMEILFRMLNFYGYYTDKSASKAVSGTHDITHAIYATASDYFCTADYRFSQRCKAVYYYLGIPTEVITCEKETVSAELTKIIM